MLQATWQGMYGMIPRLEAEELLRAYHVAVLATRPQDQSEASAKEQTLAQYRALAQPKPRVVSLRQQMRDLAGAIRQVFGGGVVYDGPGGDA